MICDRGFCFYPGENTGCTAEPGCIYGLLGSQEIGHIQHLWIYITAPETGAVMTVSNWFISKNEKQVAQYCATNDHKRAVQFFENHRHDKSGRQDSDGSPIDN